MITAELLGEIGDVTKHAAPNQIIRSEDYVYFSIQPSFEELTFQICYRHEHLMVVLVKNFKDNIAGYLVYFISKPVTFNVSEMGAAIYFSNLTQDFEKYITSKVGFSDTKFRLVVFDGQDFFVSVKWKSVNQLELGNDTI